MTPPRLAACYFKNPGALTYWERLARVLRFSAEDQCRGWEIRVEAIAYPNVRSECPLTDNTHKLAWWHHRVIEAADGDRLLLIDADTAILRPLDPIWERDFDFCYTPKPKKYPPLNGGVIFIRVSERTRAFMEAWVKQNAALMSMQRKQWRRQYGGVNQASLADVLESAERFGVRTLGVPCLEWNCEDSAWSSFDPEVTRILHVKSTLRLALIKGRTRVIGIEPALKAWRRIESAASKEVRTA